MMYVSRALYVACCAVLLAAGSATAGAGAASAAVADAGTESFDPAGDPDYANYRQAVVLYLVSRHSHADAHVCVLGERDAGGERIVSVWWREGARIIQWDGRDAKLSTSVSNLDLRRDVVESEDDLHGSTYLVTRRWVADFEARCRRSGISFIVRGAELGALRPRH